MNKVNSISENSDWTFEIHPKKGWFELNLHELWKYKDLIYLFFRRDFVAKYKQTILGPLWFIIQPLLTTLMFTVVFGEIAGISTDGMPKVLFYMSGIVAWNYFSNCLTETSSTFTKNAYIFGKVYFPRLAIPVSVIFSSMITFLIQFILLIGFIIYFKINGVGLYLSTNILLIPLIVFFNCSSKFRIWDLDLILNNKISRSDPSCKFRNSTMDVCYSNYLSIICDS